MIVTIDNFQDDNGSSYEIRYNTDTLVVSYRFISNGFPPEDPVTQSERGYPEGADLTSICVGTSLHMFKASLNSPFAYNSGVIDNSTVCGYTPIVCDLTITSFNKTECTTTFQNDGTISVTATSSAPNVRYSLDNLVWQSSGNFTDLTPGTYTVFVTDDNSCQAQQQGNIFAYTPPVVPGEKYRVEFTTEKTGLPCLVKIFDVQNNFASPIQLTSAGDNPVEIVYQNNGEFKYSPIMGTSININLIANGLFTPNEFNFASERRWFVKYYVDSVLEFQGWLISDELQDTYDDYPYPYQLVATDGLASLKGVDFLNLGGSRIYGLLPLPTVWQYCFASLGYDYGQTTLISSLRMSYRDDFVGLDMPLQWMRTLVWGDGFYGSDGVPLDAYTCLERTMTAFGMELFQYKGSFVMRAISDITYDTSSYCIIFDSAFSAPAYGGVTAQIKNIGLGAASYPVNPTQGIRFDKAISILNGIATFDSVALLNKDPSFEYGNVEGQLPIGWKRENLIDAGMHFNPANAYSGDWVLRMGWCGVDPIDTNGYGTHWIDQNTGGYLIDQLNKKLNFSFVFRPIIEDGGVADFMLIPVFSLLLTDGSGTVWWFNTGDNDSESYGKWDSAPEKPFPNSIKYEAAQRTSPYIPMFNTDYHVNIYNQISFSTDRLPVTGRLFLRFHGVVEKDKKGKIVGSSPYPLVVYMDELELSLSDDGDDYTLQIAETHRFNNLQTFAKSEKKDIDVYFYTYIGNKYISGNVLYGVSYEDSFIRNDMWKFELSGSDYDRLPRATFDAIARDYQRPMVIWEGDIRSDVFNYFDIYTINGYPGKLFKVISATKNEKTSVSSVVLEEVTNVAYNNKYTYIPKYKKNTRSV